MPWVQAGFVIIGPGGEPRVAGGIVKGGAVVSQRFIACNTKKHVRVAVVLYLCSEHLVEGLSLSEEVEPFAQVATIFLRQYSHSLVMASHSGSQGQVKAGKVLELDKIAFDCGLIIDTPDVAL